MGSREMGDRLFDGGSEIGEGGMIATVERTAFEELPQSFDQVQIGRVRREEQQRDSQLFGAAMTTALR